VTSDGVVIIDTPQLPSEAVEMRRTAERLGPIRFVINTEHHVDHIFGNYYFRGAGTVVHHEAVYANFMAPAPGVDPFDFAVAATEKDDPAGVHLLPDRETYTANMNRAAITFSGDLTLRVGDRTFELLHTPGHTPGQVAIHVPEERVVFTGDTIFSECRTFLMESELTGWHAALDRIEALDVDWIVPGHGPVTTLAAVRIQRAVLHEWVARVAEAVAKGWSRHETQERIDAAAGLRPDIGIDHMAEYISTLNAGSLWDKLTSVERDGRRL
jgi:cyclase